MDVPDHKTYPTTAKLAGALSIYFSARYGDLLPKIYRNHRANFDAVLPHAPEALSGIPIVMGCMDLAYQMYQLEKEAPLPRRQHGTS